MKKFHELKFPAQVACAATWFDRVTLRKWVSGNEVSQPLLLDGESERNSETAQRRYSFPDLVRLTLLSKMRQDLGISANRAVQISNAAFKDVASGVAIATQAVEEEGYFWDEHMEGPWLVVWPTSLGFKSHLAKDEATLTEIAWHGRLNCATVFDLRIIVQTVLIELGRPALEQDVLDLQAKQSDQSGDS